MVDTAALLKELAEIDENLIRNDLSELEKGIQHAERKQIYETLHPEAKRGALGGKGINADILTDNLSVRTDSYAADAATATGCSERTVRRNTRFGEVLKPYRAELTGSVLADNQSVRCPEYSSQLLLISSPAVLGRPRRSPCALSSASTASPIATQRF